MTEHTIEQDGRTLHGDRWTTPADFAADDDQRGLLPAWKGVTDPNCFELQSPTIHITTGQTEAN